MMDVEVVVSVPTDLMAPSRQIRDHFRAGNQLFILKPARKAASIIVGTARACVLKDTSAIFGCGKRKIVETERNQGGVELEPEWPEWHGTSCPARYAVYQPVDRFSNSATHIAYPNPESCCLRYTDTATRTANHN